MKKRPEELSPKEMAYCRIMMDKRGLPAGDNVTKRIALDDHLMALTKGQSTSEAELSELSTYSRIAANCILQTVPEDWFTRQSGHVSISNSSCLEASRSEGGKRSFILKELKAFLEEVPVQDRSRILPTGESMIEKAGLPRWKTVHPPGMSDAESLPTGAKHQTGLLTEDFDDGEQERVGFQLFCWAFFTLQEEGFLNEKGESTGLPMPITRQALGEPGCKARVVTKSKAAMIVYGQPFAHAMRELLESHPALKAGLGSGYQLHEWLKVIPQGGKPYVMVGDFEAATDHIEHAAGRVALKVMLKELNCANNSYARNYVDLLLSPRVIEEDGIVTITNSGCLMGEPGSKIALTFLSMVANCYAMGGNPSPNFATAGDDQIDASDTLERLLAYSHASKITTMVPSVEKWGIFKGFALYCQQMLSIRRHGTRDFKEIPVPKPRLLSPETKAGRGDHEVNPSFGKIRQFEREAQWASFPDIVVRMRLMFLRNMRDFIEFTPELFVPREWGGLGMGGFPPSASVYLLPSFHQNLILWMESGNERCREILAAWSSERNFLRGGSIKRNDELTNEVFSLVEEYCPTADVNQVTSHLPDGTRYRERLKAAKIDGWIPIKEARELYSTSQTYANLWDFNFEISRGFKSLSWKERRKRLERDASGENLQRMFGPLPAKPCWIPTKLVMLYAGYLQYYEGSEGQEDGEVRAEVLPGLGSTASPRLFLHYSNYRLILNSTSPPSSRRQE
jgi:hypothetical protein